MKAHAYPNWVSQGRKITNIHGSGSYTVKSVDFKKSIVTFTDGFYERIDYIVNHYEPADKGKHRCNFCDR